MIVDIPTEPICPVHIGPALLEGVRDFLDETCGTIDRLLIIADGRLLELYGDRLRGFTGVRRHALPSGEAAKDMEHLTAALEVCCDEKLSRDSVIVTLGGGATSDLGGLTASLYKRGIRVVHIATSLLAQVDASIGGKTAINIPAGKNLIGTFHAPTAIFADVSVLRTLSPMEWRSGLGEVLKTALIEGDDFLRLLENEVEGLRSRDPEVMTEVVRRCALTKSRIVLEDPLEKGARRVLNLGHTFAHAIERAAGFGEVAHGEAVACGIGLALEAAQEVGVLEDRELPKRIGRLVRELGLPRSVLDMRKPHRGLFTAHLIECFAHDKKGHYGEPEFVLPIAAGRFDLSVKLEEPLLEHLLR